MKEKQQQNWQRLEAVIRWANMSTNYFARHIGLIRGENLYQIKRGNNGISLNLADRIVSTYPQINKLWLLTGEGDMFVSSTSLAPQIPCYDADVESSIRNLDELTVDTHLVLPDLVDCDLAMRYMGHAMEPQTPTGTVVLLKKSDVNAIIPGQEYVIVGRKIVTLRTVRTAENAKQLRLVAADRERFDEMVIAKSDIQAVYAVRGKLIINN